MRRNLAIVALVGLMAAPAASQSKLEPPDLERYFRWGPFRVRPGFDIREVGFDNNILVDNENEVSDYRATLVPKFDGLLLFGSRAFVEMLGEARYTGFAENTDQSFLDHDLRARVTVPFRRFGVFLEGRTLFANERPADLEDVRPERDQNEFGGGVILELGWRSEVELSVGETTYRYDDPDGNSAISERLDRDQERLGLELSYRLLGRTSLLLEIERRDNAFLNLIAGSGGGLVDRDSRDLTWSLGVRLEAGGDLTGEARVGQTRLTFDDPVVEDLDAIVGSIEARYRLSTLSFLEAEGLRSVDFSVFADQTYLVRSEFQLRGVRYVNRLVGVEAGLGTGRLLFPGEGVAREDDVDLVSVGVRLRGLTNSIGQKTEYALRLKRSDRESTIDGFDRSQTTVTVNAVFGF